MNTVLIRPSNRSGSLYLTKMGFLPIPLGLVQLASMARGVDGNRVSVIDMEADHLDIDGTVEMTMAKHPDLVGLTVHATAAYNTALEITKRLKERDPEITIIAGGHHVTFLPEQTVRDGFDIAVLGEGDITMKEISEHVESQQSFSDIPGIVYKDEAGIRRTRPRQLIQTLDILPLPSLDLIDRDKYRFLTFGNNEPVTCLETSRGCPYGCDFCSVTRTWGYRRRTKSVDRIIQEMIQARNYGYKWIFFTDDVFLLPANLRERMALFHSIMENGVETDWIAQMRPDSIASAPEFVPAAVKSGFRVAALGVESGSKDVLKKMRRRIKRSDTEKAVRILNDNGVVVLLSFMIGAPYEHIRDMLSTVRLGIKLAGEGADVAQFTIYTPLPGTEIFKEALEKGRLFTLDWDRFDFFNPVMSTDVNPALIQLFQYLGLYSFHLRSFLEKKLKKGDMHLPKSELLPLAISYVQQELPALFHDLFEMPQRVISTLNLYYKLKSEDATSIPANEIIENYAIPVYEQSRSDRGQMQEIEKPALLPAEKDMHQIHLASAMSMVPETATVRGRRSP
ncbi:MAG: radical SAM protein [Methanomassiliicoccales archaeon]